MYEFIMSLKVFSLVSVLINWSYFSNVTSTYHMEMKYIYIYIYTHTHTGAGHIIRISSKS